MAPRQPKDKEQFLDDLSNEIVSRYLERKSGLFVANDKELKSYLRKADTNRGGNYATYHYINALIYTIKCQYNKAIHSYNVALQNDPNDVAIMNNYATLLVDIDKCNQAYEIVVKLIKQYKCYSEATMNNLYRIALKTLDVSYFQEFKDDEIVIGYLELTKQFKKLKEDIVKVDISLNEYNEYIQLLSRFISEKTRQNFKPRFSIDNGLDRNLNIEVFLDVDLDEAAYLNSEFKTHYIDYVFDNERHGLLGKFVVFFRQEKNRYNGIENPDALYLGMNEELGA